MSDNLVCFLTQEFKRGATWTYCLNLAQIVNQTERWDAHIISALRDNLTIDDSTEEEGNLTLVKTSSSKFFYSRNYWKESNKIVKEINPAIIHGNMNILSSYGIKDKYPIVETVHTTFSREKRGVKELAFRKLSWVEKRVRLMYPLLRSVEIKLLRRANHLIAVSEAINDELVNNYSVPKEKITVIPNGVDTSIHQYSEKKLYEKKADELVLGFFGRMTSGKGSHLLLPMLKKVKEKIPEVRLLIAGDDLDLKKKVLHQIKELNLSENVINFGYIYDNETKNAFLSSLDLFLLPSSHEGMSLAMLEALACQVPIITTSEAETFNHNDTFFIVPRTITDFSKIIIKIAKEEERLKEVRMKSKLLAKKYSWENTAKQTQEVYEELL